LGHFYWAKRGFGKSKIEIGKKKMAAELAAIFVF